jgi:hypothetical protein
VNSNRKIHALLLPAFAVMAIATTLALTGCKATAAPEQRQPAINQPVPQPVTAVEPQAQPPKAALDQRNPRTPEDRS